MVENAQLRKGNQFAIGFAIGLGSDLTEDSRADNASERTILKTGSPQVAQVPLIVRRPFFMTSSTAPSISRRSRHSEQ